MRQIGQCAEADYDQVLTKLDPSDVHAIEARGRQRLYLDDNQGAEADFIRLERVAGETNQIVHAVRAIRLQGNLIKSAGTRLAIADAKKKYLTGIRAIDKAGSLDPFELYERGRIYMAYGLAQFESNANHAARKALQSALKDLEAEGSSRSKPHLETIRAKLIEVQAKLGEIQLPQKRKRLFWRRWLNRQSTTRSN